MPRERTTEQNRRTDRKKAAAEVIKKRNREIMQVTVFFVALFLVMIGYFTFYALTHEEELMNNSYNNRQQILSAKNRRGSICARDGEVLAMTNKNRFDLNDPKDLGGRYSQTELRQFGILEAIDDYHRKNPDTPSDKISSSV